MNDPVSGVDATTASNITTAQENPGSPSSDTTSSNATHFVLDDATATGIFALMPRVPLTVSYLRRAKELARRKDEARHEEDEIREHLTAARTRLAAERDRLQIQIAEIDSVLAVLNDASAERKSQDHASKYGAIPSCIRDVLGRHPTGLTATQIATIAQAENRGFDADDLHPALHRMKKKGELRCAGKRGELTYFLATMQGNGKTDPARAIKHGAARGETQDGAPEDGATVKR
jgi:hypothetical protein